MHVGVVAIPGTFASSFTSVIDIVQTAEALRPAVDRAIPELLVSIVGMRPEVRIASGMTVRADRTLDDPMDDLDAVVVPTLGALTAAALDTSLALPEVRELVEALRSGIDVPTLAGACTGTFVLAEAGRLDGVRAATCWWLVESFRRRYPAVELDQTRMVLRSGRILTAGAAFAHIDLAINLVSEVSERLGDVVARHMLVDDRPARSSDALLGHLTTTDPLVTRFEELVRERLGEALAIDELADVLNVTRRTLERHVRRRTGDSPRTVIKRLRLERARHLRRTTQLSADQIARRVGYASGVTLRRAQRADDRPASRPVIDVSHPVPAPGKA